MRRALLLAAALAAPAVARAQTVPAGGILFEDANNDLVHGPFISAAECGDPSAQVFLSWSTQLNTGQSFPADAKYTVYASNKQPTDTNCIKANNGTDTFAGPIGQTISGQRQTVSNLPFTIAEFVTVSGYNCGIQADTPIYVCVQAYLNDGTTAIGLAKGTLTLSTSAPGSPTGVNATPADDGALTVSWTAPSSNVLAYDYRVTAVASPADPRDTTTHQATNIRALSFTMRGLVNEVQYQISVYARSQAGNENETPAQGFGTPVAVANFWTVYHDAFGGQEKGGCSSGAAGPVALLGVAALLAALRRRA
jgi:hypothetical protein